MRYKVIGAYLFSLENKHIKNIKTNTGLEPVDISELGAPIYPIKKYKMIDGRYVRKQQYK